MIQSQINRNIRLDLADAICSAKLKKISHLPRLPTVPVCRSLRNRGFAGAASASCRRRRLVGAKLDLDEDAILLLQMIHCVAALMTVFQPTQRCIVSRNVAGVRHNPESVGS